MSNRLAFFLVDAFATGPYTGNPAGVVLGAGALSARQMQDIAREINASETAFVCGDPDAGEPTRLRWFTPTREVDFCGHATLGAAQACRQAAVRAAANATPQTPLRFEARCGALAVHAEDVPGEPPLWWLAMPAPELQPEPAPLRGLLDALGLAADELDPAVAPTRTRDRDTVLFVRSWSRLAGLAPNFAAVKLWGDRHDCRGVLVASRNTLSASVHLQSRFFAPMFGINEDPVTGSVHGPLATLLVMNKLVPMRDGRALLTCLQGEPGGRTGLLRALVEETVGGYRVSIAGQCYVSVIGAIDAPPESEAAPARSRFQKH